MNERRNVPEIVIGPANCFADPKLGSISSLRCQKSRTPRPLKDATCEVMFRGRNSLVWRKAGRRPLGHAGHASRFGSCVAVPRVARRAKRGGARRDRTDDLMLAKHALSQLSYGPVPEDECFNLDAS
jgi:hypothetical protein